MCVLQTKPAMVSCRTTLSCHDPPSAVWQVILAVNRTYEIDHSYGVYMSGYVFGIGELREGEWISFRSGQWGAVNNPDDEIYVPSSQGVAVDGRTYVANKLPLRAPEMGEQPGVLTTSPRPGVDWTGMAGPHEGYSYDAVTQTSTYTIVGPPSCYSSTNQPCIHKTGRYWSSVESPSPPPLPPSPPSWPPGFFTPSPAPPTPGAPPDGLRFWSQANTWGGQLPQRGDTVEIPEGITIILDISPPFLWRLNVKGTLIVWNHRLTDVLLHTVFLHIFPTGTMAAGSPGDVRRHQSNCGPSATIHRSPMQGAQRVRSRLSGRASAAGLWSTSPVTPWRSPARSATIWAPNRYASRGVCSCTEPPQTERGHVSTRRRSRAPILSSCETR